MNQAHFYVSFLNFQKNQWDRLTVNNPTKLPEAVVAIVVEGNVSLNLKSKTIYPVSMSGSEESTWQALYNKIQSREHNNTLVRLNLSDGFVSVRKFVTLQF